MLVSINKSISPVFDIVILNKIPLFNVEINLRENALIKVNTPIEITINLGNTC